MVNKLLQQCCSFCKNQPRVTVGDKRGARFGDLLALFWHCPKVYGFA